MPARGRAADLNPGACVRASAIQPENLGSPAGAPDEVGDLQRGLCAAQHKVVAQPQPESEGRQFSCSTELALEVYRQPLFPQPTGLMRLAEADLSQASSISEARGNALAV